MPAKMMQQSGAMMDTSADQEEPLDNQLILDPADERWSKAVGSWEDGQEYEASVTLRQVSPGTFEVVAFEAESGPEETQEEEAPVAPPKKSGKVNSAVRSMMEEE